VAGAAAEAVVAVVVVVVVVVVCTTVARYLVGRYERRTARQRRAAEVGQTEPACVYMIQRI
jgi:hypothetical protein